MSARVYYRCPKCGHRPAAAIASGGQCPACGVYCAKWDAMQAAVASDEAAGRRHAPDAESWRPAQLLAPLVGMTKAVFYSRCAVLALIAVWGWRLIAMDYRDGEIGGSFMHLILLPIHEAGHVFFMPFGEFLTILGGSFFQLALPLAIAIVFALRNRDNFAAAVCLWWVGASFIDLAPYVYDALHPQLILLGGHTGEDGAHDWIYLLECIGQLHRSPNWGAAVHRVGALTGLAAIGWGAVVLWRQRPGAERR